MALKFLTESILYMVYLQYTEKTRAPWLDVPFSALVKYAKRTIWLSFGRNCLFRKKTSFAPFQRVDVSLYVITRLSLQS